MTPRNGNGTAKKVLPIEERVPWGTSTKNSEAQATVLMRGWFKELVDEAAHRTSTSISRVMCWCVLHGKTLDEYVAAHPVRAFKLRPGRKLRRAP